jgi:hypothetical protein
MTSPRDPCGDVVTYGPQQPGGTAVLNSRASNGKVSQHEKASDYPRIGKVGRPERPIDNFPRRGDLYRVRLGSIRHWTYGSEHVSPGGRYICNGATSASLGFA